MKTRINRLGIALSCAFVLSQSAQALTTANGDLCIGFYQIIGGAVQSKTYIFDLGKASLYRENTQSNVAVSVVNPAISADIGADLATVFGEDWAESGTVYWTIFGGADQTTVGVVDGDVVKTPYISVPVASFVLGDSTAQPTVNQAGRGSVSNGIEAIRNFAASSQNGTPPVVDPVGPVYLSGYNPAGNQVPSSGSLGQAVDSFFPPNSIPTNSQLSLSTELRGLFGAGTIAGSAEHEGALDVYRYLGSFTTAGVDRSTGFGGELPAVNNGTTLGVGQYIGTFTISTSGIVKIYGAAPSTPGYYSFATANAPNLAGGPNADADHDGISNLTEYALNTNLSGPDGSVGTLSGGVLSFTKRAAAVTNGDLTYAIEISTDLGISNPWTTLGGGTNDSTTISGTLPTGLPKQFARLKILSSSAP